MAKQTFTTGQVLLASQLTNLQQTAMLGGSASIKTVSYTLVAADAGSTVAMNSASSTTITVNQNLFSSGDIVTIYNTNTGVSTITAGTATVTTSGSLALSQNQGGVLHFTSASAAIFFQFATPASGDIEGIVTGTDSGLSGGATSGTVTLRQKLEFDAETGTTYTLLAANLNQLVTLNNASAITLTVPPSVFSAGDVINIAQIGAGQVTLAQGAGVTINSTGATATAPKLRARYSAASIICTASNTFLVVGDIA
jgi:hypothetical protein